MKRFACLVALAGATTLVAAGCDTVRPVALEVNGAETSRSSLDRELRAIADNPQLANEGVSASDGTLGSNVTAFWVTLLVQQEVIDRAVRRRGIEVTAADREAGRADIDNQFGEGVFEQFPQWFRDRVGDRFARRHALLRELGDAATGPTDEEVRAAYDQQLAEIKAQCASGKFVAHILVETVDEANALRAQLVAGADFAELARTESLDTGSAEVGGELFCFDAAQFVPEFSAAADALPLGQVSDPVQTEFGFHLIRMRDTIPFESVEEQVRQALEPETSSSPELDELVTKAEVEVDPRYGTWTVQQGQGAVVPPEPLTTTTPAPAPAP
ncbi:MAG TPA: peptidylprolyl isomerase [Acidimicrobiia bacterium]|nr:peptidylprolyl isomerase [Acidimicrobiia bacterium]